MRPAFSKMVEGLADAGLLVFGVWAVLNVLVVAFLVRVAHVSLDELGMAAVCVFDAIAVLLSRPYWPPFMQPKPPADP
jgi:hypothetical protein